MRTAYRVYRLLPVLVALALVLPLPAITTVRAVTVISVDSTGDGVATPAHCTDLIAGNCTLRDAIAAAAGDTIMFSLPAGSHTITLTNGELLLNRDVTITGPGANLLAVSGNDAVRVFRPLYVTATISGLTITRGRAVDIGGGIYPNGTLTLNDCVVTNNRVSGTSSVLNGGAGIFSDGTLTLNRTVVTANVVEAGAAQPSSGVGASITTTRDTAPCG